MGDGESDWRLSSPAMFIGHLGLALAAKQAAPRSSLAVLFSAAQLVDMVWPVLLLIGAEHARIVPGITRVTPFDFYDYPITHSLVGGLAWALLFALLYLRFTWYRRGAVVAGVLVLSHWVLDFVSHRPDMPVLANGPYVGLGLWDSLPLTMLVEGGIFAAGVALYLRTTCALDGIGRYAFGGLVAFLVAMQLAAYFGPPPPSMKMVALASLGGAVLVLVWALWIERHRDLAQDDIAPGPLPPGPLG
jgi:hypothetical protein